MSFNKLKHKALVVVVVIGVALAGTYLLVTSHAASPYAATNASSGTLNGFAVNENSGSYIQFGYTPTTSLAVHVDGDQLVNGQGKTIRLLGTDASNTEYCTFTHSVGNGNPLDSAEAADLASWHMNAVRVPLNEDCWLGINGVSLNDGNVVLTGTTTPTEAQYYQTTIENWVAALNKAGIIAILDLHWSAPGTNLSNGQWPMADASNSPTFWGQVATAFKSDPAVMFDLYNEPFMGNGNDSTTTESGTPESAWSCWLNGCNVNYSRTVNGAVDNTTYASAGMQQLVTTVRTTGATQPIILGGLNFSSDPCGQNNKYGSTASCPELANLPSDPLHQLVIDFHMYSSGGTAASWNPYWNNELKPLQAAGLPMVTDEFGEEDCSAAFMNLYMTWADQNNESYLAWSWDPTETGTTTCTAGTDGNFLLLSDWNGDPSTVIPQGANYKAHLAMPSVYSTE